MTNAERFLNAYAQCEKKLAELAEQPKYIPFSQLVARCANRSRVVALNQQSLREYNELRNAIVHIRGSEKEIIAEPCDSVTEDIERIAKLLTEPHDILKYASMPVKTVHIDTSIRDAFHLMQEMDTSKVPVYKGQNFVGMITLDEIAKVAMQEKQIIQSYLMSYLLRRIQGLCLLLKVIMQMLYCVILIRLEKKVLLYWQS